MLLLFLIYGLKETRKDNFHNLPQDLGLLFCLQVIRLAFFLLGHSFLVLKLHPQIYFCFPLIFLFSFLNLLSL